MNAGYMIVKVHNDAIRPDGGLPGLEKKVQEFIAAGWRPIGGPFQEGGLNQWCQAMERPASHTPAGDVLLREPQRKRA